MARFLRRRSSYFARAQIVDATDAAALRPGSDSERVQLRPFNRCKSPLPMIAPAQPLTRATARSGARISRRREPSAQLLYGRSQRSPAAFRALHLLGVVRYQQGRHEEAYALMAAANTVDPTSVDLSNLGIVQELGRTKQAVATYDRALALKPRHAKP
jgi:tetratricopeptide (TPR) repeat protein